MVVRKGTFVAVLTAALVGLMAAGQAVYAASGVMPWDGFVAIGGDQYGLAVNPASLSWLEDSAVRVQYARDSKNSDSSALALVYFEPDTGIGAGRLAYVSVDVGGYETKQFIYSGSWSGGDHALGFSVRHVRMANVPAAPTTPPVDDEFTYTAFPSAVTSSAAATASDSMNTWTLDLGYRGQLGRSVTAGVVIRNTLLVFGDVPRDVLPVNVVAGLAFDIGSGLVLAADYIVPDATELSNAGYHFGLDGRFGQVLARLGRWVYAGGQKMTYVGFGFLFGALRLDASAQQGSGGQTMSLGLSVYF